LQPYEADFSLKANLCCDGTTGLVLSLQMSVNNIRIRYFPAGGFERELSALDRSLTLKVFVYPQKR